MNIHFQTEKKNILLIIRERPSWNTEWKINFLKVFLKINHLGLNSFLTPKNYLVFVKINLLLSSCPSSDTTYFKQGMSSSTKLTNHFYLNARGGVGAVLGKSDGVPAHSHWGLWGGFAGKLFSDEREQLVYTEQGKSADGRQRVKWELE